MKKRNEKKYVLLHEGKVIFEGSEFDCYYKLQRTQAFSSMYAFKYGGYKIIEKKSL